MESSQSSGGGGGSSRSLRAENPPPQITTSPRTRHTRSLSHASGEVGADEYSTSIPDLAPELSRPPPMHHLSPFQLASSPFGGQQHSSNRSLMSGCSTRSDHDPGTGSVRSSSLLEEEKQRQLEEDREAERMAQVFQEEEMLRLAMERSMSEVSTFSQQQQQQQHNNSSSSQHHMIREVVPPVRSRPSSGSSQSRGIDSPMAAVFPRAAAHHSDRSGLVASTAASSSTRQRSMSTRSLGEEGQQQQQQQQQMPARMPIDDGQFRRTASERAVITHPPKVLNEDDNFFDLTPRDISPTPMLRSNARSMPASPLNQDSHNNRNEEGSASVGESGSDLSRCLPRPGTAVMVAEPPPPKPSLQPSNLLQQQQIKQQRLRERKSQASGSSNGPFQRKKGAVAVKSPAPQGKTPRRRTVQSLASPSIKAEEESLPGAQSVHSLPRDKSPGVRAAIIAHVSSPLSARTTRQAVQLQESSTPHSSNEAVASSSTNRQHHNESGGSPRQITDISVPFPPENLEENTVADVTKDKKEILSAGGAAAQKDSAGSPPLPPTQLTRPGGSTTELSREEVLSLVRRTMSPEEVQLIEAALLSKSHTPESDQSVLALLRTTEQHQEFKETGASGKNTLDPSVGQHTHTLPEGAEDLSPEEAGQLRQALKESERMASTEIAGSQDELSKEHMLKSYATEKVTDNAEEEAATSHPAPVWKQAETSMPRQQKPNETNTTAWPTPQESMDQSSNSQRMPPLPDELEDLSPEEREQLQQALKESERMATTKTASSQYDLSGAEEHLSQEELLKIQQALQGEEPNDDLKRLEQAMQEHEESTNAGAIGESDAEAIARTIREADAEEEAIARALREADEEEERKSLLLALQLHKSETERKFGSGIPQGNVRTVTREEFEAHELAKSVTANLQNASYLDGPPCAVEHQDEEQEQVSAGFRMNSSARQEWSRRDQHSVVGPNMEIRTKHDISIQAMANAHRLGLDADDTAMIGNAAYNSFIQSVKSTKKGVATKGTGRAGSDTDATKGGAMDPAVRAQISRAINNEIIEKCNGIVKEGKEAVVYHADEGTESDGFDVAIKVFKRIQEFRGRGDYVEGDPRYRKSSFQNASSREQLELWAEKEFRNLMRANKAGVPVPSPLLYKENIIFMRFLGTDGWPAPQLRELELRKGSKRWRTLYEQVIDSVKRLYQKGRLVHGDLSEYNIMVVPASQVENRSPGVKDSTEELQAVLIDFGQAVDQRHPSAHSLLERDLDRIIQFFSRQGVETMSREEFLDYVTEASEKF